MDLATAIGLFSGLFLLFWAISMGGSLMGFYDLPSVMIVLGGTFASTLISFPLKNLISVFGILNKAFFNKAQEPGEIIATLVGFAEKARREGLLALEMDTEELNDEFLRKGIQLVVDGADPELVRSILDTELAFLEERHKMGREIFQTMGNLAPAFGMIGTLIGLIQMLGVLNDPKQVGPGMATALLTTFYGTILANLIFNPIAGKLQARTSEEILIREIMIEGILSIQAGENPRIVEEKMKVFLAPKLREKVNLLEKRVAAMEGEE